MMNLHSRLLLVVFSFFAACGAVGGPVAGAVDSHCGSMITTPTQAACAGDGGVVMTEAPEVRFNTEADDDDCKYHVKYSATPVQQNADVTFTITVTRKSDGAAATGAAANIEASLGDTHPAPNSGTTTKEATPGTYTIGPVRFDKAGQWTVRFHLYEDCSDVDPQSPHGHVGFAVNVP